MERSDIRGRPSRISLRFMQATRRAPPRSNPGAHLFGAAASASNQANSCFNFAC
jgi:hypothetical protein